MMTVRHRRAPKKNEQSFIATPLRVLAIVQLCFAFAIILSHLSHPFMGELFNFKAHKALYHYVMGKPIPGETNPDAAIRRSALFANLPLLKQAEVINHYRELQIKMESSFSSKVVRSLHILAVELPMFERMWLVLSIAISILLLLRRKEALHAAWLLPLVALLYALNNGWTGQEAKAPPDKKLFPSEATIVSQYLETPLSTNIEEQRQQLTEGWKKYLLTNWSPKGDALSIKELEERAEFAFNVARLSAIMKEPTSLSNPFNKKEPWIFLVAYIFWNLFFACFLNLSSNSLRFKSA